MTEMPRDPRLEQAFGSESDAELEARVPDYLVDEAWPRLAAELVARPRRRSRRWLPLAMAAALAVMVTVSGWLAVQNRSLRQRSEAPVTVVVVPPTGRTVTAGELVARLSQLPSDTPVLTAEQAEDLVRRDRPLFYALISGERFDAVAADGVTAGEAVAILGRLAAATPIRLGGAAARRS